jgi:hypothetical protein
MGKVLNNGTDVSTYPVTGGVNNVGNGKFAGYNVTTSVYSVSASGTPKTGNLTVGSETMGVGGLSTAHRKKKNQINNALQDRTESPASGYLANGVPDWQSGKIARNTIWSTDREVNGGDMTYFQPLAPVSKTYGNMTT